MKASVFDGTQSVRLGGMKAQEETPRPARAISQSSHPIPSVLDPEPDRGAEETRGILLPLLLLGPIVGHLQ